MEQSLPADLAGATYISLESLRRNGRPVRTPVWFASVDGTLYVYTDDSSWKAKRMRNNPAVRVAACSMNGTVRGDWHPARARFVHEDAAPREWDTAFRALIGKQGVLFRLFVLLGRLGIVPRLRRLERHRVIVALELM